MGRRRVDVRNGGPEGPGPRPDPDLSYAGTFDESRNPAEAALRESEDRFRATFEQAAVGLAHVAPDGTFLRVNRRFAEILGYDPEELAQLSFPALTHPDDVDRSHEVAEGLFREGSRR